MPTLIFFALETMEFILLDAYCLSLMFCLAFENDKIPSPPLGDTGQKPKQKLQIICVK